MAARQLSRGEPVKIDRIVKSVTINHHHRNEYVCAELSTNASGLLSGLVIKTSSCALDKGR